MWGLYTLSAPIVSSDTGTKEWPRARPNVARMLGVVYFVFSPSFLATPLRRTHRAHAPSSIETMRIVYFFLRFVVSTYDWQQETSHASPIVARNAGGMYTLSFPRRS